MSIAMWARLEALEQRITALEAARTKPPANLGTLNSAKKADAAALRQNIAGVTAITPGATAKEVLKALETLDAYRRNPPSVRTIQRHMSRQTPHDPCGARNA